MGLAALYIILGICLCTLLVLLYTLTLLKALSGTRYRIVITMILLLLASNVAYIALLVGNQLIIEHNNLRIEVNVIFWNYVQVISQSVGDLLFCEAHWIMAVYYKKIANNIPRVIEKHKAPKEYKYFFRVGAIFNAVFPIGEGLFMLLYLNKYFVDKVVDLKWYYLALGFTFGTISA